MLKSVILKKDRRLSIDRRHPWIFSRGLVDSSSLSEGDLVDVFDEDGSFLARGYFEDESIAVRILTFDREEPIDFAFWLDRLSRAYCLRQSLILTPKSAFRLVNGEGDGLPGITIDIYADIAVLQAHTFTMHKHRDEVAQALKEVLKERIDSIYYKAPESLNHQKHDHLVTDQMILGKIEKVPELVAEENGILFYPNVLSNQKSIFPLDQRENHQHLKAYSKGRRVLNLYSNSGGSTISAMQGGATHVTSIDSSSKSISLLEKNLSLNFASDFILQHHQAIVEDPFKYLQEVPEGEFDVIILDPPPFAKRKEVMRNALLGYRKLNMEAMKKIAPHGFLFTFSSSQIVDREVFRQNLFTSALMADRRVRIVSQLSQSSDHPVSIFHPEGEYLKGFVLYID